MAKMWLLVLMVLYAAKRASSLVRSGCSPDLACSGAASRSVYSQHSHHRNDRPWQPSNHSHKLPKLVTCSQSKSPWPILRTWHRQPQTTRKCPARTRTWMRPSLETVIVTMRRIILVGRRDGRWRKGREADMMRRLLVGTRKWRGYLSLGMRRGGARGREANCGGWNREARARLRVLGVGTRVL